MGPSNKQSANDGGSQRKKPGRSGKTMATKRKVVEVSITREALVRRVVDARRAGLVVLAARAIGGGLITLLITSSAFWLLAVPFVLLQSAWIITPLTLVTSAALVVAARFASIRSMPEAASYLEFLKEKAFLWVDPFRDDRPHFMPLWVDAILWAPTQVLAGAVPFRMICKMGQADADAAADVARRMVEESELELTNGVDPESAEAKGLRQLLALHLARLVVDDSNLKVRVSGLGQAALFEGTVA
jgi:hypothetical protein